jgi:protocatechuate 3,4-dioxygenase beta subunit
VTRRPIDRITSWVAAFACLTFAVVLVDVPLRELEVVAAAPASPLESVVRDGALVVQVIDADGLPIPGAAVKIFWERDGRYYLASSGETDENGALELRDLPRGKVWVLADAPGHARGSTQLVVGPLERTSRIALVPEHRLKVRVRDDAGAAIPDATVLVRSSDPLPFGALSDLRGEANVTRLPPPPWQVQVSARGYETVTRSDVSADFDVVLRRLGGFEVRVLLPNGQPADDASVFVAGSSLWPARKTRAGRDGVAKIVGLLAGVFELKAIRGSLVSDTLFGVSLERGEIKRLELQLYQGRMVTAVVTDGDDEHAPVVPNADVVLVEGGIGSFPLRGRTGTDGSVVLGPISKGPATLAASADGFVPRAAVPLPEPVEGPVQVPLLRGATLRGDVVDSRGFPVDGASVEIIGSDIFGLPVMQTPFLMNFGRAHFEWSLSGPLPLIPAGELGVMPGPIPPIPGVGASGDPGSLSAGAALSALLEPREGVARVGEWVTRADGSFVAHPVSPGRVRALVRHPDYVEGLSQLLTLGPGAEGSVRVVLHVGGILEGRILDDRDFPVAGARVDVAAAHGTWERSTLTGTDGSFAFAAVPQQAVVSVARPDELGRIVLRKSVSVEAAERTEIDINLPKLREQVRVRVVDDRDQPVAGAQVTVMSIDPESPLRQTRFTDEEGAIVFDDARGLALRIAAEAIGWVRITKNFAQAPADAKIQLLRGVVVQGRVTSVRGRIPVEGASVLLSSEVGRQVAFTDADGVYRISDVPAGAVEIVASHPDFADGRADAVVKPTGREDRPFELPAVDLSEAGQIEGEVLDARGNPVLGARVAIGVAPAYLPAGALPPGMATTDSKGRFKLNGVAPGNVEIEAYAAGVGRGRKSTAVTSGRTTSGVRIELVPSAQADEPPLGASVAITLTQRSGPDGAEFVITHVASGSEAERAGLRAGDLILAIDDHEPASLDEARARLTGPQRSDVVIEVERGSESVRVSVPREMVRQ